MYEKFANRQTDFQSIRAHLQQGNTASLRIVALLGGILMPLFWLMDMWVVPDYLWITLGLRLSTALYAVALIVAIRRRSVFIEQHVEWFGFSYTALVAATISVMCWLHKGYESPYYAGLNLVIVGAGLLFLWPLRFGLLFSLTVWGTYIAPLCLGIVHVRNIADVIANQFFIFGTIVITLAAQSHRYGLEVRAFVGNKDLERTKASLEDAFASLQEHDRLKSQFFSNITHELRTPLTMILAPLESILAGELAELDERQREYLVPIYGNGLKLLKLINDLLDLAKIEESFMRLRVENCDIAGLLRELTDYARPLSARKDISLELRILAPVNELFGDVEKLERAIINLLSNSLKFTEPGGHVNVSLDYVGSEILIGVRDDGQGIAHDQLDVIFERFRQADGAVTRRHGGTGIGLALAKEIVELHGGSITVESQLGVGSHFVIHLKPGRSHLKDSVIERRQRDHQTVEPRRGEDREPREWSMQIRERDVYRFLDIEKATERRLTARGDDRLKSTRILIVEDNVDVLKFLAMQLREEHAVYVAPDGKKGLELAVREVPDVIITDYMMPEMDGLRMLRAIKANPVTSDIPVIMLTAKNHLEDKLAALEVGADVYLTKPFSPRELRSAVHQLLRKRGRQAGIIMREQVRSLEVIAAGLAHEVHNPLSRINGALFVVAEQSKELAKLAAESCDAVQADRKRAIVDRINHMQQVAKSGIERIQQVIEVVRRYGREGYPREVSSMAVDQALRDMAPLIMGQRGQNVSVEMQLDASDAIVQCIPEEMEQVFRNIWQNALDAVGEEGQVWVRTSKVASQLLFEVKDTGPGMSAEVASRIFTPFFTTKGPGRGLGVGLTITHRVVSESGGHVEVDTAPGMGTTMRVYLPIFIAEAVLELPDGLEPQLVAK